MSLINPGSIQIKFNFTVGAELICLTSRKNLAISGNEFIMTQEPRSQEPKNQRKNSKAQWAKKNAKNKNPKGPRISETTLFFIFNFFSLPWLVSIGGTTPNSRLPTTYCCLQTPHAYYPGSSLEY